MDTIFGTTTFNTLTLGRMTFSWIESQDFMHFSSHSLCNNLLNIIVLHVFLSSAILLNVTQPFAILCLSWVSLCLVLFWWIYYLMLVWYVLISWLLICWKSLSCRVIICFECHFDDVILQNVSLLSVILLNLEMLTGILPDIVNWVAFWWMPIYRVTFYLVSFC